MRNEEDLINALARGEEYALEILFEQHYEPLWKYSLTILRNPHDAEEVVNDTFFRAYRYRRSFAGKGSFAGWLFKIARNLCMDYLKKRNAKIEVVPDIHCYDKRAIVPHNNNLQHTLDALNLLKLEYREVIILKDISGYSLGEIAAITDKSLSSVKSLHHRALKAMENLLKEQRGGLQDGM